MDEYASMRLTLRWAMATTLPKVIVTNASTAMTLTQSLLKGPSACTRMRIAAANAATLGITDM